MKCKHKTILGDPAWVSVFPESPTIEHRCTECGAHRWRYLSEKKWRYRQPCISRKVGGGGRRGRSVTDGAKRGREED